MVQRAEINRSFVGWELIQSLRWIFLLLLCMCGGSCATHAPKPLTHCPHCQTFKFNTLGQYPVWAYANPVYAKTTAEILHIYLEGDGKDWGFGGKLPPSNPTTKKFTALKLMQLDTNPAVYINRPCYGHKTLPKNCMTKLWTSARYGSTILENLNAAITQAKSEGDYSKLVLIGHSGGGSLAMLIADIRQDISAVITLAANLDHKAWTTTLKYDPLKDSLNAARVRLSPEVFQWHLAGSNDKRVPAAVIKPTVDKQVNAYWTLYEGFDHNCCWASIWPGVLHDLNQHTNPTQ